jgi:hypothetical protein
MGVGLPVFGSIFIWSLCVFICAFYTTYFCAPDMVPKRHRAAFSPFLMAIIVVAITLLSPFLCSSLYRIAASSEGGDWILWGCYIDYMEIGLLILLVLLHIPVVILFIFGMVDPKSIRFQSRLSVAIAFLLNISYAHFMVWAISDFVKQFSGELHGMQSYNCF